MTFQNTFDLAMDLCDERSAAGTINTTSTAVYLAKAPGFLTLLNSEVARGMGIPSKQVTDLTETSQCGDYVTLAVLPFGLAAMLLADENPQVASYYQQKFEEAKRRIPTTFKPVIDVYNLGSGGF